MVPRLKAIDPTWPKLDPANRLLVTRPTRKIMGMDPFFGTGLIIGSMSKFNQFTYEYHVSDI